MEHTPHSPEQNGSDTPELLKPDALTPAETRRTFSRLGLALLVMTVAMMAVAYTIQYTVYFFFPQFLQAWWINWVLSLLPLYGVGLPFLLLFLRTTPPSPHNKDYTCDARTEEKPRFTFGHWMILLIIGFGGMYLGSIIGTIVMNILSTVMDYPYANALVSVIGDSPLWMIFLGTCVCAPLGEEFIFRKLLIDRTRRFGDLPSILLSGFLFALFHGNLFQFFYAFILGMVLAYAYTRSGKLLPCVAIHAIQNLFGSILIPRLAAYLPEDALAATPGQLLLSLGLVIWQYGLIITAVVLVCVLWNRRKLSRGTSPLPRENGLSLVLLNPGMMSCVLVMLLLLVIALIPLR